jgi:hypothetical protein
MFWKTGKGIFGSLPGIQDIIVTMVKPCLPDRQAFNILQLSRGLPVIMVQNIYMKIKPEISGSALYVEHTVTMPA